MKLSLLFIFITFNLSFAQSLNSFVPDQYKIFDSLSFDFNNDNIKDNILVLESRENPNRNDSLYYHSLIRPFIILQGTSDSTYSLKVRNDHLILDRESGGTMGDPYQSIETDSNKIIFYYYGGTSWRWNHSFEYTYDKKIKMWYLTKEFSDYFSIWNVDSTYTETNRKYYLKDSLFINTQNLSE